VANKCLYSFLLLAFAISKVTAQEPTIIRPLLLSQLCVVLDQNRVQLQSQSGLAMYPYIVLSQGTLHGIDRFKVELIPAQNNGLTASDTQEFQKSGPAAGKKHSNTNNRSERAIHQMLADESFMALSAGVYAGAILDMYSTEKFKQWYSFSNPPTKLSAHFSDPDPLARPFVDLSAPAYYASGLIFATGLNLVAWKLKHSPRFHKVWWVPQTISVSVNVAFGIWNVRQRNDQINDWKANNPHR
jgi:hypothetical protein